MNVQDIDIANIKTDYITNCRKTLNTDDLKASIEASGLQTPLGVADLGDGSYGLVYGFRRLQALKELNIYQAPCTLIDNAAENKVYLLNLQENVTRRNLTPIEEAEAINRLISMGEDPKDFASALGWSKTLITQRLSLLDLSEPIREALQENTISVRQAKTIDGADEVHHDLLIDSAKDGATINSLKQEIEQLEITRSVVDDDVFDLTPIDDEIDTSSLDDEYSEDTSKEDKRIMAEANNNVVKVSLMDCGAKLVKDKNAYFAFQIAINCIDFAKLPAEQLEALVSAVNILAGERGVDAWGESAKR